MKKLLAVLALSIAMAGCAKPNSPTPPLAPGYQNTSDQTMGQTLAAANAFYNRIQTDSAAGTVTLSAAEKTALNALATALNIANPTYLAFHNGTATQAAAQSAINDVTAKQQAVQALGVQ